MEIYLRICPSRLAEIEVQRFAELLAKTRVTLASWKASPIVYSVEAKLARLRLQCIKLRSCSEKGSISPFSALVKLI